MIQVSLDSDDGEMMKRIRKAVQVEKVFETIQRIRETAARRAPSHAPKFSISGGVYDPSIWTLERFVRRLVDMNVSAITFWDLVEYPHQTLVRPLNRLEGRARACAPGARQGPHAPRRGGDSVSLRWRLPLNGSRAEVCYSASSGG